MGQYTSSFVDKGFSTPRQLPELNKEDLEALGVGPIGHQKKILKAINNTKEQVSKCLRSYQDFLEGPVFQIVTDFLLTSS